ncbi:protein aurora borealis [Leptidea sinapis]|uniref:protein aurora borealis n=1 Tax=Leptidea sinapis TaxID=189913 RepID=UPI00212279F2|nr:protein aurora borealis [Leptidea sinapis]
MCVIFEFVFILSKLKFLLFLYQISINHNEMNDGQNEGPIVHCKSTPQKQNKVRNPFDRVLVEKLHKPLCSPGMCKIYKSTTNESFKWDIDQACTLTPADIVVCNSQFEPSPDPDLEKMAQEATDQFFSQEIVLPSPMEVSKKHQLSSNSSSQTSSIIKNLCFTKTVSVQTTLTFPPVLPPEVEQILENYCTHNEEQAMFDEYEVTANGSLRRILFFEESDHDDSEQTDDEIQTEKRPPSVCEPHTPVVFSPDLCCGALTKGMKRTFGTPLRKDRSASKPFRNKILDVVDFGDASFSPIVYRTPKKGEHSSATSSSLASSSISPINKASGREKNDFTSPESDSMCLECAKTSSGVCCHKTTPNKSILKRSVSLKDSPKQHKKGYSLSGKRSLSMSSLTRSKSVQKLDFSMDMSVDGSTHNISQGWESIESPEKSHVTWSIMEDASVQQMLKVNTQQSQDIQSSTHINFNLLDETPIKGKRRTKVAHEISKIRDAGDTSHMSLDDSLENFDIPLSMEENNIDFNKVDLKFLTDNEAQYNYNRSNDVMVRSSDCSTSFKRLDSGFNENTIFTNASSYYESAIKPSELTITNISKTDKSKTPLKEISNVNWMRLDSGFKDETSSDSMQFYLNSEIMKETGLQCSESMIKGKENVMSGDMNTVKQPNKVDCMFMSDTFNEDLTFTCNYSSTPSKNKSHQVIL